MHPNLFHTEQLVRLHMGRMIDKAGRSLADHCARVVQMVPGYLPDAFRHVAWMHDLIEDTDVTLDHLRVLGYSEAVRHSLALLTHDAERVPYMDYIRAIAASGDAMALTVKYLDNKDNSAEWRLVCLPEDTRRWLTARYAEAAPVLERALATVHAAT